LIYVLYITTYHLFFCEKLNFIPPGNPPEDPNGVSPLEVVVKNEEAGNPPNTPPMPFISSPKKVLNM